MGLTNKAKVYIRKNRQSRSARQMAAALQVDIAEVEAFLLAEGTGSAHDVRSSQNAVAPLSGGRKLVFTLIALSIPILFFVSIEGYLRLTDYRGNTDLFIPLSDLQEKYMLTNPNYASRYFFYTNVIPNPPVEPFLRQKPANGFRAFVMGESSAAGYPYGFNGVPGRVTRDVLQDVLPDHYVEVITVATSAINSYTLYDQVDEILAQQPDAIFIYTGHNEFYGALGAGSNESLGSMPGFVRTYLKIQRLKTFMYLRDKITAFSRWTAAQRGDGGRSGGETLMQQVVRDQAITLDSRVYSLGKRQFESNMTRILEKFERAGVPVFIASLASNLRDHPPFESIETAQLPGAATVFAQAQQLMEERRYDEAYATFAYARDLDALKFRATTEFNGIIQKLAERPGVFYVPVEERFTQEAEHGIIGFDLMLEHLHPNEKGYFLIGWSFFERFREANYLGLSADETLLKSAEDYFQGMAISDLDRRINDHRLMILTRSWPFVKEGPPFSYRGYQVTGIVDSLAYEVVQNKLRWDRAKVLLGEYYMNNGRVDLMLSEFRGLMRDQPYNDSPFLITARIYLDRGRLVEARPYLERAHEIEPSAFTWKMLGSIQVHLGNFQEGIDLIEESLKIEPRDPQAIFNLSGAYAQHGNLSKGLELVNELLSFSPNFPGAREWKSQLESVLQVRR
jgi:tetratricopeptide (TPR) repeat protein